MVQYDSSMNMETRIRGWIHAIVQDLGINYQQHPSVHHKDISFLSSLSSVPLSSFVVYPQSETWLSVPEPLQSCIGNTGKQSWTNINSWPMVIAEQVGGKNLQWLAIRKSFIQPMFGESKVVLSMSCHMGIRTFWKTTCRNCVHLLQHIVMPTWSTELISNRQHLNPCNHAYAALANIDIKSSVPGPLQSHISSIGKRHSCSWITVSTRAHLIPSNQGH